ncbi:F0F1 ATP synthase subunit B [Buchnera aphidicola]|uniref:F0F1 ATP synthase subunit B n=1 Tax=Buchnera aphidicola TaxID=9 RepID=UPI0022385B0E|nr:F0F1 ATP synthase subunit B [Buchnera aphidicola]MCW5197419.1 F0F1 ATP synthase subunit B [Buchnera aphidicola (Chaitophorus viminalis)]
MNINATIFGQSISFIFFVFFCMKFIWPNIIHVIKKRQKNIRKAIFLANQEQKKYIKIKSKISKKILDFKRRSIDIIRQAETEKDIIIKKSVQQALLEKNKILQQAQTEIFLEKNKAKKHLRKYSVLLAIQIAKKIIQEKITEKYTNKLIKDLSSDFKGFKI